MTAANLDRQVDLAGIEPLRELLATGNGLICASGHMGLWELCGHITALQGLPTVAVSRPAKNPAVESVLRKMRESGGQRIIAKWGVLYPLHKALKRGELIGVAADEDTSSHATFAPFLGTLAATSTTSAMLARRTKAPIAVVSCNRVGRGMFKIEVWDVIKPGDIANPEHDDAANDATVTARISAALSRAILAYPEQWLWGSRRFATRPEGEVAGADGLPPRCNDGSPPNIDSHPEARRA